MNPNARSTARCAAVCGKGRYGSDNETAASHAGSTARSSRDRHTAAMYCCGGRSWVMRRTQFAVSEMGSGNTARKARTEKTRIHKVDMAKSVVMGVVAPQGGAWRSR